MRQWIGWFVLLTVVGCHPPVAVSPVPSDPTPSPDGRTRVGNGGMDDALRNNAWFLGNRSIRVCLENGSTLTDADTESAVTRAFATWQLYLEEKKVNLGSYHSERTSLPSSRILQAKPQWVSCQEKPDLRVVVGKTDDAQINWERLNEFSGRSAFVMRRRYDPKTGWGQGDMWIASPDRMDASLQTALGQQLWLTGHAVHELGHILGCGHVPDTMMDKDFNQDLTRSIESTVRDPNPNEERALRLFTHPDQQLELVTCEKCGFRTNGSYHQSEWGAFAVLFGTEKLLEVSPTYDLSARKGDGEVPVELHFSASDPDWEVSVPLENLKLLSRKEKDIPIFKVAFQREDQLQVVSSFQKELTYEGQLTGHGEGEPITMDLTVLRNGPLGPLVVELKDSSPWLIVKKLEPLKE